MLKLSISFFTIFFLSFSIMGLHFMETIENDGLLICEMIDTESSEQCQTSHTEDNDNDNETVQVSFVLDLIYKFQLNAINLFFLISLPLQWEELYFYLFSSGLIKPPICS